MKHLLFFYYTLSYSIGLPSLVVLIFAFLKVRIKKLVYLMAFLVFITLHLAYITYVEYQFANYAPWYTYIHDLVNNALLSVMVIALPLLVNEWFNIRYRNIINLCFGALFLISLSLILGPYFLGMLNYTRYVTSLLSFKIFLGFYILTYCYVLVINIKKFFTLKDPGDLIFNISTLVFLLIVFSQIFFPIFPHFPECYVISIMAYFFWNIFLLKYIISKYFLYPTPNDSLREVIDGLRLTDREKEVLYLLAQGQPNREIGAQLFISEDTVKTHVKNIYRKLEVNNRVKLFNLLKENRLSPG